jgi:hypothetical protein
MKSAGAQFQDNPEEKVCKTPSQWGKLIMMICTCHPSYDRKYEIGGLWSRLA